MVILKGIVRWATVLKLWLLSMFSDIIILFLCSRKKFYCIWHQKFFGCFKQKNMSRMKLFLEMIFITSHATHGLRFIIIRIFFSNLFHFLWNEIEQIERKDSKVFQIKSSLKMPNISQRLIFCELRHFICQITYDLKRRCIPST